LTTVKEVPASARATSLLRSASSSGNKVRPAWSASFGAKHGLHLAETSPPSLHFSAKVDMSPSYSPLARRVHQPKPRNDKELSPDVLRWQLVIESR
jgi:hypothetical protein